MNNDLAQNQTVEAGDNGGGPPLGSHHERMAMIQYKQESMALARNLLKDSPSMFLNVVKFEHAQRVATMLAASDMVPKHFQGNLGNCMIALNLADRLRTDVFMLMQTMYVVHGRPGLEGKIVTALINNSGIFTGPLQWRFDGKKGTEEWTCTAYATHKATGEKLEMSITWQTVVEEGWYDKKGPDGTQKSNKWRTMPEQMFRYRTASWFSNAYCPEVKMGLLTVEELRDVDAIEVAPGPDGTFAVPDTTPTADKLVVAYGGTPKPAAGLVSDTKDEVSDKPCSKPAEKTIPNPDNHRPTYTGRNSFEGREGADPSKQAQAAAAQPKQEQTPTKPAEKPTEDKTPPAAVENWKSAAADGNWWDYDGGRNWKFKRGNTIDHIIRLGLGITTAKVPALQEDMDAVADENPWAIRTLTAATKETRAAVRAKFEAKFGAAAADALAEMAKTGGASGAPNAEPPGTPSDSEIPPDTDTGGNEQGQGRSTCFDQLSKLERGFPEHYEKAIKAHGVPQDLEACKKVIMAISIMVDEANA